MRGAYSKDFVGTIVFLQKFGFASHWLKKTGARFYCVFAFGSHLKTPLSNWKIFSRPPSFIITDLFIAEKWASRIIFIIDTNWLEWRRKLSDCLVFYPSSYHEVHVGSASLQTSERNRCGLQFAEGMNCSLLLLMLMPKGRGLHPLVKEKKKERKKNAPALLTVNFIVIASISFP